MTNAWIAAVARAVRDEMVAEGYGETYQDINNGNCDEFADRFVSAVLEQSAEGDQPDIVEVEITSYFRPIAEGEFVENGSPLNRELLATVLPNMTPPEGMSWDELDEFIYENQVGWGLHVFAVCDGLVYDSEAPDGVPGIFDLPFYERYLASRDLKTTSKKR
jgi:hypothetical protein